MKLLPLCIIITNFPPEIAMKNTVMESVYADLFDKVFYVTDPKHKDWEVVRHVKLRDVFDMGTIDDQVGPYSNDCTFDVPSLHRIGDDGEDGIDITPDMEHGEDVEENDEDSILF
ncbi:hypothetical protein QVD17_17182 [Tagetes erecta]|uniref:DUF4216 domain-containing protein n=1 Tax=Tagetes erecta TaxID=13708 RepID=A0AAD8KTE7_TARER|nr:hypothetical protein QVD17_17182 [Tagetes erecta]